MAPGTGLLRPGSLSATLGDDLLRREGGVTLGEAGLRYEAALLGLSREEAMNEMKRRYRVMEESVRRGFR